MGGFGSGRRREISRGTVESHRGIDIDELSPGHLDRLGTRLQDRVTLQVFYDHITLTYHGASQAPNVQETIAIANVAGSFGARRRAFVCPGLGPHQPGGHCVRRLYEVGGRFRCRHCHRLTYASQSTTAEDRAHRRANAVRTRLGGAPGIAHPFPSKPPRMWRRTYARLEQAAHAAEDQATQAVINGYGLTDAFRPGADRQAAQAMVLEHLRRIAFLDVSDLVDHDQIRAIHDIPPEARSAIASYTATDDGRLIAFRTHNRVRALIFLAKYLGLL